MAASSPDQIVEDALRLLVAGLRRRDIDGVLALFHSDAVLFGSEDGEQAIGAEQLRAFLTRLFDRPHTYGWSGWDPVITGGSGGTVWFVAPSTVVVKDDAGGEASAAYRLSGVLEQDTAERWLFRLFNGSEPARALDDTAPRDHGD